MKSASSIIPRLPRPKPLAKYYDAPKTNRVAPWSVRKFSATSPRPFVDQCLVHSHTFLSSIHDTAGLSWAATIPLTAVLVRVAIWIPVRVYSDRLCEQLGKLHSRIEEIETAMERKNYTEMQKAQDRSAQAVERELIKLKRKELWIECISLIRFPIWLSMMETIRRMTGTGKQVPGLGLTDGLIPMEPSLATEGLLWIDDLSAPDPSLVLPFALSGIMFVTYIFGRGSFCVYLVPKTAEKKVRKKHSWAWRLDKFFKLGAVAIAPATFEFPSAMLLYWISGSLTAFFSGGKYGEFQIREVPKSPPDGKPRMQEYRGPTMQELRAQKKKN